MREKILTSTDDAAHRDRAALKYGKDEDEAALAAVVRQPRQRSFVDSSNLRPSGTPSTFDLDDGCGCGGASAAGAPSSVAVNGVCVRRCFLYGTTLRDPGVPYFACGACGALSAEPRIQRAFDGCVFRGMCRSLSKRGRRVVGVVCALIAFVIAAGCRFVLPSSSTRRRRRPSAPLRPHRLPLTGHRLQHAATVLVGPGHVTTECNPLLPKARVAAEARGRRRRREQPAAANAGAVERRRRRRQRRRRRRRQGGVGAADRRARRAAAAWVAAVRGDGAEHAAALALLPDVQGDRAEDGPPLHVHKLMHRLAQRPPPAPASPPASTMPPSHPAHRLLTRSPPRRPRTTTSSASSPSSSRRCSTWAGRASTPPPSASRGWEALRATRGATYTPAAYKAAAAAAGGGDANATGLELLENLLSSGGIAQPAAAEGLELLLAYRRLSAGDAFGDLEAEFLLLVVCVPTRSSRARCCTSDEEPARRPHVHRVVPPRAAHRVQQRLEAQRPGRLRRRRRRAPRARSPSRARPSATASCFRVGRRSGGCRRGRDYRGLELASAAAASSLALFACSARGR